MESKQIAPETKTAEEILDQHFTANDKWDLQNITNAMQAYADQEKRKEAVAFAAWMACKYHTADKQSLEEWYDMCLRQPPELLTPVNK